MGSIAWLLLVAKEVVDIDRGVVGDLILVFIGVINIFSYLSFTPVSEAVYKRFIKICYCQCDNIKLC